MPNDLDDVDGCFSPGVSTTADFELDLAKRGIASFLADASVENAPVEHPLLVFDRKFLGGEDSDTFITLDSWVERYRPAGRDLVLQMDIEGGEFEALLATGQHTLGRFRIIIVEFHELQEMLNPDRFELFRITFQKLLVNFRVVHLHPNNCCGSVQAERFEIPRIMEFTFLRRDRLLSLSPARNFPHLLDRKNVPHLPDLVLPPCWYGRLV